MKPFADEDIKAITNFKVRRKKAGLTLRFVEDKTGVSNAYLSQLETGKITNPSLAVVVKLHNLYCEYETI